MNDKKIALITGGAQGIGYACAEALAEEGVHIVLADINTEVVEAAAKKLSDDTLAISCDIGSPKQVLEMFDQIESQIGSVSILVNCAGVALSDDLLNVSLDDFQKVIDINLTGTFVALQRAAQGMVKNNIQGSIVNMSSINAQVAIPSIPAYCASKGGVMQLTKSAALSLAPHGIRVNAVGPGSIDTAMLAGVSADPEAMKKVMSRTPLQRIGTPAEVANVVAFLASEKASYISGETIYIDGGRLAMNYTC